MKIRSKAEILRDQNSMGLSGASAPSRNPMDPRHSRNAAAATAVLSQVDPTQFEVKDNLLRTLPTSLLESTDTPDTYVGQALMRLRVRADERAMEFADPSTSDSGSAWVDVDSEQTLTNKTMLRSIRSTDGSGGGETVTATDEVVLCNTTVSSLTMALPAAINGKVYIFKKLAAANTLTIDANGSEFIDQALTAVLTALFESISIVAFNSNWYIY